MHPLENASCEYGVLYLIATPIGNLGDLSHRALQILNHVALIYCEDTRVTRKLTTHWQINTPLRRLDEHVEIHKIPEIIALLQQRKNVAVVSDAGSPLIQDPGYQLVNHLHDAGFSIQVIPGACSIIVALQLSGLPVTPFCFAGFIPKKGKARIDWIKKFALMPYTLIAYESALRLSSTLADCCDYIELERPIVIARELTKQYEEVIRGPLHVLNQQLQNRQIKGEVVLLIGPAKPSTISSQQYEEAIRLIALLQDEMSPSAVAKCVAKWTGVSKKEIYQYVTKQSNELGPS